MIDCLNCRHYSVEEKTFDSPESDNCGKNQDIEKDDCAHFEYSECNQCKRLTNPSSATCVQCINL